MRIFLAVYEAWSPDGNQAVEDTYRSNLTTNNNDNTFTA